VEIHPQFEKMAKERCFFSAELMEKIADRGTLQERNSLNNMLKNLVIWLVIGLVLMTVFNQFNTRQMVQAPMEYSQFLDEVKARVGAETGKEVVVTHEKDPALIGGLVIRIGNILFDGSLKAELERMREKLSEGVD